VSGWREVEIYGTFIRLTGELEVIGAERLSDSINRFGAYLQVRNSRAEPLSTNYPVLSRLEPRVTIAKAGVILVSPLEEVPDGNDLQDHLERHPGDFLPVTNLSALWITAITNETHAVQRAFALLNPASILSFSLR
jgi:hypothetical protein